jgi:hypothetical protein
VADGRDETRQKDRTSNKYAAKKAASERLAAQRAAQQRAERRRNVLVAGGSTLGIIIVVVVIVVVGLTTKKNSSSGGANAVVGASSAVTSGISTAATSNSSAKPDFSTISGPPKSITGDALKGADGKPQVLYIGAEYCPYCAATRWPLAVALARFGTFDNLKTTYSADNDQAGPHIPTLSFHGSSYTSQYIDFVGVEHQDGAGKPLESLTDAQNTLFENLGGGAYPFIDFGGKWMQKGSAFDPNVLKGMTPDDVAKAITDPSTKAGKTVQAGADVFSAIICEMDGGQPSNVCTASGVTAAEAALNGGK